MFDQEYYLETLKKIINYNSPTGYCLNLINEIEQDIQKLGFTTFKNNKGNLMIKIKGHNAEETLGISAHIDTLGLMVRSIKANGNLAFTLLGGPQLNTLDGEYCTIITRENKSYRGTIISNSSSSHVYENAQTLKRDCQNMEIRLDEIVKNSEDTLKLGINNGDFIAIDPKFEYTSSGFIKSRFLDDKTSAALILTLLKTIKEENIVPKNDLILMLTTYEEVGHGASNIPSEITKLLAVDMGCVGLDLSCTEQDVSICAKDSRGPYDYQMTTELINIAKANNLNYAVDIYPMYGSDVGAALSGGNNIKGALIGPGVAGSHGMERTHINAIKNTFELILNYI